MCPRCGAAANKCKCRQRRRKPAVAAPGDGILRIRREVKGRKGKRVTTISGFDVGEEELKEIAAQLKRLCGTGGSVKEGVVIIQGDHRTAVQAELARQGYTVKLAGG